MNNKALAVFSAVVGLFLVSGQLFAHHSEAALDKDHATTVTGTVTKWVFANPHPTVFLEGDVKDSQGRTPMTFAEGVFLAVQPPVAKPATIALLQELMGEKK